MTAAEQNSIKRARLQLFLAAYLIVVCFGAASVTIAFVNSH